jgi:sugar/nucleoside kinase (ribokinase family)
MKHKSNKTRKVPFRVVCLGNVLVDMLVKPVNRLPPPGGLLPVDRVEMAMGGCASNTAIALSRLGVSTSLWGKLGGDTFGGYALKELKKDGVDTSRVIGDSAVSTSATLVLVDSQGQRSFLHSMAANDHIHPRDIKLSLLSRFDHLHIGGYFLFPTLDGVPMARILRMARQKNVTTSLDTAWDLSGRWMKALKPCLPYLDYFMPSEREVKMLLPRLGPGQYRKAAREFLRLGCRTVIIKRGEKGSYLLNWDEEELNVPAFRTRVVDTTGAGDCYCAGFIKGLSLGWKLRDCMELGNAAGACAVRALGATAGIKNFEQVRSLT